MKKGVSNLSKAMGKFTNIPSDIQSFFSEKRRSVVMNAFTCLLEDINLDCRSLGGIKRENCRLTNLQVFEKLVLFPFFAIKGYSHYAGSALKALLIMAGGYSLYSSLSQDNLNWRKVIYRITNRFVKRVVIRDDPQRRGDPLRVLNGFVIRIFPRRACARRNPLARSSPCPSEVYPRLQDPYAVLQ